MRTLVFYCSLICIFFANTIQAVPTIPTIPEFPQIITGGATYHVNNVLGTDASPNDGSEVSPWGSLKHAIGHLSPGDTLIIHGTGTAYDTQWANIVRSDTDTRWITLQGQDGAAGERATITGRISLGDTNNNSANNIHLNNLLFFGPGGSNINIVIYANSYNLAFENIEMDCNSDIDNDRAIWTQNNVNHVWFKDMNVHHCGYSRDVPFTDPISTFPTDCGGICIKYDQIDEIVFDNVIATDNVGDGLGGSSAIAYGNSYFNQCRSERNTGDGYDIGGTRVVFINSLSKDNGGHQGTGFKLWSKESWLVNSVAYNNDSLGINIKPQHSGDSYAYILNSTLVKNNTGIYGGQISTSERHPPNANDMLYFYLYNNILHGVNTGGIFLNNDFTQRIQEEGNNYFFSDFDGSLESPHWTYQHAIHIRDGVWGVVDYYTFDEVNEGGRWTTDTGLGIGSIGETDAGGKTDPGFVDLGAGDFNLTQNSLAVDTGVDVGVETDILGSPVPIGVAPDMGAYELTEHDSDSVPTLVDNCPYITNPNQQDLDMDGIGDVCDSDVDGDSFDATSDCNDLDASIYPDALETSLDGIDQNCNGSDSTIDVYLAEYDAQKNKLVVNASSSLNQDAALSVDGYGLLDYKKGRLVWKAVFTNVMSYPSTIIVSGIEGSVMKEVQLLP